LLHGNAALASTAALALLAAHTSSHHKVWVKITPRASSSTHDVWPARTSVVLLLLLMLLLLLLLMLLLLLLMSILRRSLLLNIRSSTSLLLLRC
jgi:hypothetical protein